MRKTTKNTFRKSIMRFSSKSTLWSKGWHVSWPLWYPDNLVQVARKAIHWSRLILHLIFADKILEICPKILEKSKMRSSQSSSILKSKLKKIWSWDLLSRNSPKILILSKNQQISDWIFTNQKKANKLKSSSINIWAHPTKINYWFQSCNLWKSWWRR